MDGQQRGPASARKKQVVDQGKESRYRYSESWDVRNVLINVGQQEPQAGQSCADRDGREEDQRELRSGDCSTTSKNSGSLVETSPEDT